MRQAHRAGEKTFIDFSGDGLDVADAFSGDGLDVADAFSGECQKAVLFVAVLGASNLTYAEPVLHQDLPTWIGCHVRAFEYFGGVTPLWVPDNPKVGVTRASKYEPDLNRTYADLARHYEAVAIPARPYRPRDKAKVEAAVLIAERWILAVLRNRTTRSSVRTSSGSAPSTRNIRAFTSRRSTKPGAHPASSPRNGGPRTADEDRRNHAGRALYEFYIGTVFRHGLFNADPHPGNLLFQEDGSVVILDHGCVVEFESPLRAGLAALSRAGPRR